MFSISNLHTPPYGSPADVLRSATFDLTTANTGFRYAHATLCYARLWPASDRASLHLQRTRICPRLPTPSPLDMRLSLPAARQLHRASPIANNRPPARPNRTDSSSLPASLRPTSPPTRLPRPSGLDPIAALPHCTAPARRQAMPCTVPRYSP